MSVIIHGMEMPKSCDECRLFNECWCMALGIENWRKSYNKPPEGERLPDCPLVPLPEGHGKLIDGHKLYRALFATECGNIAADRDSEGWPKVLTYETVKKAIQDATTIVPADVTDNYFGRKSEEGETDDSKL